MKISIIVCLAVAVSVPQITQAQASTTYLSNLDQPSSPKTSELGIVMGGMHLVAGIPV